MLICWNAEGVHGKRQVGNPWSKYSNDQLNLLMNFEASITDSVLYL